jgi:hypothetical protein
MNIKFDVLNVLTLLGFVIVIFLLHWLFPYLLETKYLVWYLENGTSINWGMALVALIYGSLEHNPYLISSKPREYFGGHMLLLGEVFLTLGIFGVVKRESKDKLPIASFWHLDQFIAITLNVVFGILLLCWILVVMPIQYFLFFICGAPARTIICSKEYAGENDLKWWANGIREKPIAVTAGFTGMFIWI